MCRCSRKRSSRLRQCGEPNCRRPPLSMSRRRRVMSLRVKWKRPSTLAVVYYRLTDEYVPWQMPHCSTIVLELLLTPTTPPQAAVISLLCHSKCYKCFCHAVMLRCSVGLFCLDTHCLTHRTLSRCSVFFSHLRLERQIRYGCHHTFHLPHTTLQTITCPFWATFV